jgi:hypothetical protein
LSEGKERLDVMVSHDWPLGIEQHGDTRALLRKKPFFREEVETNTLGNPANREILDTVKPRFWFAAHLHVKFKATVQHQTESSPADPSPNSSVDKSQMLVPSQVTRENKVENSEANTQDLGADDQGNHVDAKQTDNDTTNVADTAAQPSNEQEKPSETEFHALESENRCGPPDLTDQMTQFLALDKCLPRRQYLSIMHIDTSVPKSEQVLEYDPEWLAIVRKTHHLTCTQKRRVTVPQELVGADEAEVVWVTERIEKQNKDRDLQGIAIPSNFSQTVPVYTHPVYNQGRAPVLQTMGNPQTDELLGILELEHKVTIPFDPQVISMFDGFNQSSRTDQNTKDTNEIDIDDLSEGVGNEDENEIDIDDQSDDSNKHDDNEIDKSSGIPVSAVDGPPGAGDGGKSENLGMSTDIESKMVQDGPKDEDKDKNEKRLDAVDDMGSSAGVGEDSHLPLKRTRCDS